MGRGLDSRARIDPDGSIVISLNVKESLPDLTSDHADEVEEFAVDKSRQGQVPKMSIVVMIVGSRGTRRILSSLVFCVLIFVQKGDVQPYVALGKKLTKDGHRIRIASHETFRSFVENEGLELYDIGGDPRELMSYMVKSGYYIHGYRFQELADKNRRPRFNAWRGISHQRRHW